MKYTYFITLLLFFSTTAFSQLRDNSKLSDEQKHKVAHKLIEINSPYNAIPILEELVKKHPDSKKYIFKLAEAYFKSRNYIKAEVLYPKLEENLSPKNKETPVTIASFHYAECLKYNAKYEKAREVFEQFSKSNYRDIKGANLKVLAKNEVKACEFAMQGKTSDIDVEFSHLGNNINSNYTDFSPSLKDDSTLIFASMQADSVIAIPYGERHDEHVKLFESKFENGTWAEAKVIKELKNKNGHSANGSFSADRKRFYFTNCINKSDNRVECKIYLSKLDTNGNFGKPEKLGSEINAPGYSSSQPVVGMRIIKSKTSEKSKNKPKETKEEVLFFASDRKGTLGGTDIWYSSIASDGYMGDAINCGRNINSVRDEITPYYDTDAGVLYFSSNFHAGFGGFDVFKSKGWNSKWQKPENLKKPINTNYDETYYTLLPDNKLEGFLVSNRVGGYGLLHPSCCDDIWQFNYKIPSILVINTIDEAGNTVSDADIKVISGKYSSVNDSSSYNLDASIDFDTVFANEDKHFLKVIGIKEPLESYYIIGGNEKVNINVTSTGFNETRANFLTDSLSKPVSFKVNFGNAKEEIEANLIKVTINMQKGNLVYQPFVPTTIEEKKDTVKIASTLQQEYAKVVNEPKSEIYLEDTTKKKVVEEIDFTINLTFEYKTIELTGKNKLTLDSLVSILKKDPKLSIAFTTHTDGIGSENYNLELSQKRAQFLANYVLKSGVPKRKISGAKGVGESKPLFPEILPDGSDDPAARAKNRRTEIRLFKM